MPADSSSTIAGRGEFAGSDFAAGEAVLVLDRVETVDDLGLVNHSCDPNLGFGEADGVLYARRDIAAGDELTLDYAMLVSDPAFVLWCHCETYRCRQAIEGNDWMIPQLQQRYAGSWAPDVQALIDAVDTGSAPHD